MGVVARRYRDFISSPRVGWASARSARICLSSIALDVVRYSIAGSCMCTDIL